MFFISHALQFKYKPSYVKVKASKISRGGLHHHQHVSTSFSCVTRNGDHLQHGSRNWSHNVLVPLQLAHARLSESHQARGRSQ
jgi:hypothetical protein